MFLSECGLEKSLHDTSVPIVQYNDQNHIIFNTQEIDCSLFMTYIAKQDHLQLIKVIKSYNLAD